MRGLKIILWIAGIGCLVSVVGLFLPVSTWGAMAEYFGIESLPDSPLFFYAARLLSAVFGGIGIFFIILALRPMDYGVMVPFSGLCAVALGVICGITGFRVKMPTLWFLGDSLSCLLLGVLILAFWQQAKKPKIQQDL